MFERFIEVAAIYGIGVAALVLMARYGAAAQQVRDGFTPILTGWSFLVGLPGAIYVLSGILPGQ